MFAIASAGFGVSALPVGAVVVTFGPRISCIIGSVFLSTGALLLAFAADLPFDGHIPGFLFLGLGGPFIYISSFHLANAFPTHSTLIRSAITGAFDSSSALFLFLSLINEANAGFSTRVFFLVYLVVPVLVLATQTMPGPYKSPAELVLQVEALRVADTNQPDQDNRETIHKIQTLLDDNESISKTISPIPAPAYPHRGFGDLPDTTSTSSGIVSQPFLLLIVFSMTQILSLNYFLVSISTQHSDYLARTFSILLPLGGLLFTPIPTYLSVTPLSSLAMLVTSSTTLGILTSIPSLTTTYLSILLYVLYRPFLFTALSDYVARVFGTRSYGLKYGILVSVSGLGNLGIPGLDVLSRVSGYAPVNILLTGLSAVTGLLVIWPAWRDRPGYLDGSEDREREREPLLEAQTQTQTQTQSYGASEM